MIIIKKILCIIGLIIEVFCALFGLLLLIMGMVESIVSMTACGIVVMIASIFGAIFFGKRISKATSQKTEKLQENYNNPLKMQIPPDEKLELLKIEEPDISLYEGEVCYYRKRAFAKNFYEGTLYITNIRFILLAEKYGFDIYISKITQFKSSGSSFELFSGSKCYLVFTTDEVDNYVYDLVQLMNNQGIFKDEKWLKEQQKHVNSISSTNLNIKQELSDLKWLLDEGIITQEEFDAKKKQLLGL